MNAAIRSSRPAGPPKPPPGRRWLGWAVAGLVLLGVGAVLWWQFLSEPPQPWRVRRQITRYLTAQTGQKDFQVPFDFPSQAAMAKSARDLGSLTNVAIERGPITRKSFQALSTEYLDRVKETIVLRRELEDGRQDFDELKARLVRESDGSGSSGSSNILALRTRVATMEKDRASREEALARSAKALEPLASDLWAFQRAWIAQQEIDEVVKAGTVTAAWSQMAQEQRQGFNQAMTWAAMYELIGQQLWVADRLFASANVQHRRLALTIILQACHDALNEAQNGWLAARLCEGYVWPHLDLADDPNRRAPLNLENLLNECVNVFRRTDEPRNVLRTYHLLLARATNPQRADYARVQLAQVHEQAGEYREALAYLKAIKNTNDFTWALRRVPWLQDRLKYQR